MNSFRIISGLCATTAPIILMTSQPVCSQIPKDIISPPAYYSEFSIAKNSTTSINQYDSRHKHQIKNEKELAFGLFEEQRVLNENEAYCYGKMLENLSYKTGVNVLEIL